MNLGNALKVARSARGMRQEDLAQASGLSISYISLLERNKRDPTYSSVKRLAGALRMPTTVLVFLAAEPEEVPLGDELRQKLAAVIVDLLQEAL